MPYTDRPHPINQEVIMRGFRFRELPLPSADIRGGLMQMLLASPAPEIVRPTHVLTVVRQPKVLPQAERGRHIKWHELEVLTPKVRVTLQEIGEWVCDATGLPKSVYYKQETAPHLPDAAEADMALAGMNTMYRENNIPVEFLPLMRDAAARLDLARPG